jgi:hypothetical protein
MSHCHVHKLFAHVRVRKVTAAATGSCGLYSAAAMHVFIEVVSVINAIRV